jgi:hypothetical protein
LKWLYFCSELYGKLFLTHMVRVYV